MSYWDHARPVRRTRAVDVQDVARAAVDLLDEGGLRALTVRAVAGRLGVAPASLYSRVASVDDLFDLALDVALGDDPALVGAVSDGDLEQLLLAHYRHLVRHHWACQVIAMRPPRGPHALRLSERLVLLLEGAGAADPLTAAYLLSNFVIGSAVTAPVAGAEHASPVDATVAPHYAHLHRQATGDDPEQTFLAGITALRDSCVGQGRDR